MNSKLQGKIGRFQLKVNKELKQQLTSGFQVALDKSYYVLAQMKHSQKWWKGRILDCKLASDYDITKQKNQNSFVYYIHFEDLDKRNDDWIPYSKIRSTKQKIDDITSEQSTKQLHPNDNPHQGMSNSQLQIHQQITKFKTIYRIQLGKFVTDAWYFSPYPIYYHNLECLYICDFCLSFYIRPSQLKKHSEICPLYHPPGDQIYRDELNKVAVFEVDGYKNPVYCENLAFLSKLFLDHKNLHSDMSIFLFYILCQIQNNQYHIAGYFSKVKETQNNLSCILVLPFYQRKGYGKFLITFSYQLSLIQQKVGSPQKPLSDLGKETYLSWWTQRLIDFMRQNKGSIYSVADISRKTGMTEQDIKWTLEKTKLLKLSNGQPYLCTDEKILDQLYKKAGKPGAKVIPQKIHFIPYRVKWQNSALYL